MTPADQQRISQFVSVTQTLDTARATPRTPQTEAPAYRLAFDDRDFLLRDEMRGIRLQLELMKPEMVLQERGIRSTIVMFGGARIPDPDSAEQMAAATPGLRKLAPIYTEARQLARMIARESLRHYGRDYVVCTGGGPGVMEAGNRGATDVGAHSIGLNIVLPHEQAPNSWVTPDLCFNFHYFAVRKMHFLMRARAIVVFPGGYGTLDELFEALTLIQTQRMEKVPVLLFHREFWDSIVNFPALAEAGTIAPEDLDLFQFVETADEAWAALKRRMR